MTSVAIRTNPKTRESRLFSNIGKFVFKSGRSVCAPTGATPRSRYFPYAVF